MNPALRGKSAIAGVGESARWKASPYSVLGLALQAAQAALDDATLPATAIDCILTYQEADSNTPAELAAALGLREVLFYDLEAGGASTETLIAQAIGLIEAGIAERVLIYRSMLGRTGKRMGGGAGWTTENWEAILPQGPFVVRHGVFSAGARAALLATRFLYETGFGEDVLGSLCVTFYGHAQLNERAVMYGKPLTLEEYFASPYIAEPMRRHDYCLETDEANALIVARAEGKQVRILGAVPKLGSVPPYQYDADDPLRPAAASCARRLYAAAGVGPGEIDVAGVYDCFSWAALAQLEAYGFVPRKELGEFVKAGELRIGGKLPTNTAGGMLSEGYTHGMNNVLELVRQLRGDYAGTPRQVRDARIGLSSGWGGPAAASGVILAAS
jgi:acetyl-CoA acetyltransferase